MARVSPSVGNLTAPHDLEEISVAYELVPIQELATLDLSVSIRSRLLSRKACEAVNRFMRRWGRLLDAAYTIALLSVPLIIIAPIKVGRVASIVTVIMSLPGALLGPTLLRYELIRLLVNTYDFWFFFVLVVTTFSVLGGILGAPRGIYVLISALGALTNVVVDANLRVPKSWVFYSCIAITMHLVTVSALSLELIDGMHGFTILRVRDHVLPATTFASNGLLTVCALLGRSVYRRREAVAFYNRGAQATRVRCVGYRTLLCFTTTTRVMLMIVPQPHAYVAKSNAPGSHIEQLHHDPLIGRIDASKTVLPVAFHVLLRITPRHHRLVQIIHALAIASITVTFLAVISTFARDQQSDQWVLSATLAITAAYCFSFALCYHRLLFMKLVKSFDFVFLAAQITVAHACVCDFFRWTPQSMKLVATSWIWIHWVLCIDALTPIVRSCLRFHVRAAAPALTLCFIGSTALVVSMVSSPSVQIFDRTLWSGVVFGHRIHLRVVPVFYNCFFTAFALMLRILGRLYTVSNETLLVLDGAVAYENSMLRQKKAERRPGLLATN